MTPIDDTVLERLVDRAKAGEKDAFGEIYESHVDRIFGYVAWRVSSRHDAEDITQNVFIRAIGALPRFEHRGVSVTAWLFRIAHNLVANHYRDSSRSRPVDVDDMAHTLVSPLQTEALALAGVEGTEVREAIRSLTAEQQQVVVMRFLIGLTLEQTAEVIEKPVGAVKSLQHRALASLGRAIKPSAPVGGLDTGADPEVTS